MEIKVGEYVRYDDGTIIKVSEEEESYYNYLLKNKKGVFKHSKRIIDLIEVGDYVNGECVDFISTSKDGKKRLIIRDSIYFFDKYIGISTILTHEQFEQNAYRLEGK